MCVCVVVGWVESIIFSVVSFYDSVIYASLIPIDTCSK